MLSHSLGHVPFDSHTLGLFVFTAAGDATAAEKRTIHDDIWCIITDDYLDKRSLSNLSLTSHKLHPIAFPALFKELSFTASVNCAIDPGCSSLIRGNFILNWDHEETLDMAGSVGPGWTSLPDLLMRHPSIRALVIRVLRHLEQVNTRIDNLLHNPHLCRFIQFVEVRCWLVGGWCSSPVPQEDRAFWKDLKTNLSSRWFATFLKLLDLINSLTNLKRVTFLELHGAYANVGPSQVTNVRTPIAPHEAIGFSDPQDTFYVGTWFAKDVFQFSPNRPLYWTYDYFRTLLTNSSLPIISLQITAVKLYDLHPHPKLILDSAEQFWIMKPVSSVRDLAIIPEGFVLNQEADSQQISDIIRNVGLPSVDSYYGMAGILNDHVAQWPNLSKLRFLDEDWESLMESVAGLSQDQKDNIYPDFISSFQPHEHTWSL
ncbi:hypothetical protein M422DRAFT_267137 [Sphaerobolus stellatus SS14]|uniref:Uncharacterized protein n=1 Tax=Sphaerobolus stellatus (strain SS14) TaxID=990650 RepID=A0A0C9UQ58_SPHS4|nr:hypothetical protein M422DRAFT_267137 [Sphaerobolus stellatus SS14]